jgi:hypothetical protein
LRRAKKVDQGEFIGICSNRERVGSKKQNAESRKQREEKVRSEKE